MWAQVHVEAQGQCQESSPIMLPTYSWRPHTTWHLCEFWGPELKSSCCSSLTLSHLPGVTLHLGLSKARTTLLALLHVLSDIWFALPFYLGQ